MLVRTRANVRACGAMTVNACLLAAATWLLLLAPAQGNATTYAVNSVADVPDGNPGDNVCETLQGNGLCTLRAAVQESNAHAGPDSIVLQANASHVLTRFGIDDTAINGDLDILDSVAIAAPVAGASVDGNGDALLDRVFDIAKCVGNAAAIDGSCINGNVVASIAGVTIRNGKAGNRGGGIQNDGDLTLTRCVIADNRVTSDFSAGGGIDSEGPLLVTNCTIRGNTSVETGGGLRNTGPSAVIAGSTISGNTSNRGGGVFNAGLALKLVNSTISGNSSRDNGGGIYAGAGAIGVFNSTIAVNTADADNSGSGVGGGVWSGSGTAFEFTNSVISLNARPFLTGALADDCAGTITSQGNSIVSDINANHCTVNGAFAHTHANLTPLQDNGGPTVTHALTRPSDAIDTGDIGGCTDHLGAPLTTDQRGSPRPQGARCDIGAFEASDAFFGDGFES